MSDKDYNTMTAAELEQAAEKGDTEAMFRIWLMFKDGEAGEPYFKALGFLEKAAATGHRGAVEEYEKYLAEYGGDEIPCAY